MQRDVQGPLSESIGQRLRRLRLERGMSQRELAEPGVSYAYISRIEAGTRSPSVKALRKLARKLSVTPEYLETGSEIGEAEQREMRLADAELELRLSDDPGPAEEQMRALLDEAVLAGDVASATRARVVLGSAAAVRGRPDAAVALLEEAIASETVPPASRPDVYAQLGRAYAALGRTRKAVELFEQCLAEVEENEPENVAARIQYAVYLSHALTDVDDFQHAYDVLASALEAGRDLADPYTRVKLYWSLARLSTARGRPSEALRHARRAIALLEATEDTAQLGRAHLLCGAIYVAQKRPEDALEQLETAEQLLGPHAAPQDVAYVRTEQAKASVLLGRGADAAAQARDAIDLLGDTEPAERGAAWLALAEGMDLEGDPQGASDAYGRATSCLEQAGKLSEAAEAYRSWGRALRRSGRETDALDVLEKAADLGVRASHA